MTGGEARPAVVLGGGLNALSITRSLGSRGVPVDVLAEAGKPLSVRNSRHCRRYLELAAPVQDSWLEWLLGDDAPDSAVLLAGSDEGLELIATNRGHLIARGHVPMEADDDVVLALLDKARTYDLALEHGVAAPRAVALRSPADLAGLDGGVRYPAVLKAQVSHLFVRRFPPHGKGRTVRSHDDLVAAAEPILADGVPMVLTELVEGPHDAYCSYYTYLDEQRRPLVHVTKRKLRQYPIGFGEGTYHQMAPEPEAAAIGLRFFEAVGLRGIGNVEFKRDARDGQLKLIECNLRFTQADALLRRAGIDLPLLAYSRLVGWPLPDLGPQRDGVHLWVPRNDVRAMLDYRRSGELSARQWLRSLSPHVTLPLFDPSDPGPTVRGMADRVRRTARRRRGSS